MFFKKQIGPSTESYWNKIKQLKDEINAADAILIGAGAGLSVSAGITYDGEKIYKNFSDFSAKYGLNDMYSAGFYPYDTLEEYWAYWSRHIYLNRYQPSADKVYLDLLTLIKDKDYFILTTNVDHCFQKSGFNKQRLFYTQGDYGLWQCSKPCCQETFDNKKQVLEMYREQSNMKIPTSLIPYCPYCGASLTMNLRIDDRFVEDTGWKEASYRYLEFVNKHKTSNILYLELGVGNNTPAIIKYPFWQMTHNNFNAVYSCLNNQESYCPPHISGRSINVQGDIGNILADLLLIDPK